MFWQDVYDNLRGYPRKKRTDGESSTSTTKTKSKPSATKGDKADSNDEGKQETTKTPVKSEDLEVEDDDDDGGQVIYVRLCTPDGKEIPATLNMHSAEQAEAAAIAEAKAKGKSQANQLNLSVEEVLTPRRPEQWMMHNPGMFLPFLFLSFFPSLLSLLPMCMHSAALSQYHLHVFPSIPLPII